MNNTQNNRQRNSPHVRSGASKFGSQHHSRRRLFHDLSRRFLIPHARALGASVLTGVLLFLAFPPVDVFLFAWVALVPWFLLITFEQKTCRILFYSWLTGLSFNLLSISWLSIVTVEGYLGLCVYMSLYFVIFAAGILLPKRFLNVPFIVAAPCLWVTLEFIRSFLFTGFPWLLLGHSQYRILPIIQIADVCGVYGITFLIVVTNGVIADLISLKFRRTTPHQKKMRFLFETSFALFLISITLTYGTFHLLGRSTITQGPRISAVQGNIPQILKNACDMNFIWNTHEDLTALAVKDNPDLIVWSETMIPNVEKEEGGFVSEYILKLEKLIRSCKIPFLVGAHTSVISKDNKRQNYNSACYYDQDGVRIGRYDKIHLVPVSEYNPSELIFPYLPELVQQRAGFTPDFLPGTQHKVWELPYRTTNGDQLTRRTRFSVLICYETIFPPLCREFIRRGAEFFINISNDAWFLESAELDQALAICVFRCVENRVGMVRVTNNGISAFITPDGAISRVLRDEKGNTKSIRGVLTDSVLLDPTTTFYTLYGDVFAWATSLLTIGILTLSIVRALRKKAPGD